MKRKQLTDIQIEKAIKTTVDKLSYRLHQKGYGTFTSSHEILGVIAEEYYELVEAVHNNNQINTREELKDLAVGCIFAVACMEAETIDW